MQMRAGVMRSEMQVGGVWDAGPEQGCMGRKVAPLLVQMLVHEGWLALVTDCPVLFQRDVRFLAAF